MLELMFWLYFFVPFHTIMKNIIISVSIDSFNLLFSHTSRIEQVQQLAAYFEIASSAAFQPIKIQIDAQRIPLFHDLTLNNGKINTYRWCFNIFLKSFVYTTSGYCLSTIYSHGILSKPFMSICIYLKHRLNKLAFIARYRGLTKTNRDAIQQMGPGNSALFIILN